MGEEFAFADVPALESLNVLKDGKHIIKKGKLKAKSFAGSNMVNQVPANWWTVIPALMNFQVPTQDIDFNATNHSLTSMQGTTVIENLNFNDYQDRDPIATFPIGAGIEASFSRNVTVNEAMMNTDGKQHMYRVADRVSLLVGIDSPRWRELVRTVPMISGNLQLKFFEKQFEFIHYSDTIRGAYLSKFELLKIMKDINNYVAFKLEPLEVVRVYHKYGFDLNFSAGTLYSQPAVTNIIGMSSGVNTVMNRYFTRDAFGQIHYFIDKGKNLYGGFETTLMGFGPNSMGGLALLNFTVGGAVFRNHQKDWVFKLPETDRNKRQGWDNDIRRYDEFVALNRLTAEADPEGLPEFVDVGYEVEAKGSSKIRNLGLFYLFNRFKSQEKASSKVRFPDGQVKNFFHLTTVNNRFTGPDEFLGNLTSTFDICVKNRRRTRVDVELEEEEAHKFTVNIKTEDFFHDRNLEQVGRLITDLNYRYSQNKGLPFYRDFVLPSQEEVDKYPMVYGLSYSLIYGQALLERLKTATADELEALAREHFTSNWYLEKGDRLASESWVKDHVIKAKVAKVMHRIKEIWQVLEQVDSSKKTHELAERATKLVQAVETDIYGLYFFRKLLDHKGMFVMGEVSGLLKSFTSLSDFPQLQRRRFMGRSWGEFRSLPPLQKFLRRNRLVPPSFQINKLYSDRALFGQLETAVAPNIASLYSNDFDF